MDAWNGGDESLGLMLQEPAPLEPKPLVEDPERRLRQTRTAFYAWWWVLLLPNVFNAVVGVAVAEWDADQIGAWAALVPIVLVSIPSQAAYFIPVLIAASRLQIPGRKLALYCIAPAVWIVAWFLLMRSGGFGGGAVYVVALSVFGAGLTPLVGMRRQFRRAAAETGMAANQDPAPTLRGVTLRPPSPGWQALRLLMTLLGILLTVAAVALSAITAIVAIEVARHKWSNAHEENPRRSQLVAAVDYPLTPAPRA